MKDSLVWFCRDAPCGRLSKARRGRALSLRICFWICCRRDAACHEPINFTLVHGLLRLNEADTGPAPSLRPHSGFYNRWIISIAITAIQCNNRFVKNFRRLCGRPCVLSGLRKANVMRITSNLTVNTLSQLPIKNHKS